MTRATSKRAEVLRRVLRYLNDDNYLDSGEQLWFGCEPDEGLDKTEKFFLEFHREIADYASQSAASERTTLGREPEISNRLKAILEALARAAQKKEAGSESAATSSEHQEDDSDNEVEDDLDRYYASEVINKLDAIVGKASRLGKISPFILPNRKVQISFEEAHRCYLYGFQHACAVFCRSILEAALKEVADPDKTNGNIYSMIELAEESGRLTDDRPSCARQVYTAGNMAIHDP